MVNFVFGIFAGLGLALLFRLVNERGHAVFGVVDKRVQEALCVVLRRYTTLLMMNEIHSGSTHQLVFSGGTVLAYFEADLLAKGLPPNARSYVVWGKQRRMNAALALTSKLQQLGYEADISEPLSVFPPGTFLMVTSSAFLGSAHAFRPHWIKMVFLEARAKRLKK